LHAHIEKEVILLLLLLLLLFCIYYFIYQFRWCNSSYL